MARNRSSQSARNSSWGPAIGLLAGCAATLAGIVMNLPPNTILFRSVVSGCIVGTIATLVAFGWQLVTPPQEEDA